MRKNVKKLLGKLFTKKSKTKKKHNQIVPLKPENKAWESEVKDSSFDDVSTTEIRDLEFGESCDKSAQENIIELNVEKDKPIVNGKLVIFLVEESSFLNDWSTFISKQIGNIPGDNFLCIIRYNSLVESSGVKKRENFAASELELKGDLSTDDACFYNAIYETHKVIDESYKKVFEDSSKRYKIMNIELIGIGTCSDTSSCDGKDFDTSIELFNSMLDIGIVTKYFCTNEIYMKNASKFGFRSIASIDKSY